MTNDFLAFAPISDDAAAQQPAIEARPDAAPATAEMSLSASLDAFLNGEVSAALGAEVDAALGDEIELDLDIELELIELDLDLLDAEETVDPVSVVETVVVPDSPALLEPSVVVPDSPAMLELAVLPETPALLESLALLDGLMARVGVDGLSAAYANAGLLAQVDQHTAAVREALATRPADADGLASYAKSISAAAERMGRPIPGEGDADLATADWRLPDWHVLRLVAVCAIAESSGLL